MVIRSSSKNCASSTATTVTVGRTRAPIIAPRPPPAPPPAGGGGERGWGGEGRTSSAGALGGCGGRLCRPGKLEPPLPQATLEIDQTLLTETLDRPPGAGSALLAGQS